ncbi:MAG: type II toxin-antitoxin system PemK/MazF family toxin [Chlamydiales bacterium]
MNNPMQGEVWFFDPDPIIGNEIGKKIRPCLIISSNSWNKIRSGLVIIVPITSVDKNILTHVRIDPPDGGLKNISFALCEQIRSISKERLKHKIGSVKSHSIMNEIRGWILDLTRIE